MKKKHIIHSAALLLGLCLAGCKESLPDNFGAIEGIYFYNQLTDRTVVDSAAYTFIYEDADVLEVPVRLQLVGRAAAQPRAVDVRVTSQDAEEGTDYTLGGEAVLPAGSVSFDYVVTLKRTDILKEKTKNLLLELRANENFIIPFTSQVQSGGDTVSAVTFKINFSDQFTAPPAGWRSLFVGPFSQQKFELICDVMEIPRADFNEVGKITNAKWLYIESRMINYVRDQEKLKAGESLMTNGLSTRTATPAILIWKEYDDETIFLHIGPVSVRGVRQRSGQLRLPRPHGTRHHGHRGEYLGTDPCPAATDARPGRQRFPGRPLFVRVADARPERR